MCDLMEKLDSLSAAEDFFDVLDVPYERSVISINHQNILRRFHQNMLAFNVEDFNEYEQRHLCREQLTRAYRDFVRFSSAQQNVLNMSQDA